jgi:hypothetical protein
MDAVRERDAYLLQRDQALGERNELRRQLDVALGERNEFRRQLDVALGERNEFLHQRDLAKSESNLQSERMARQTHRADMLARRGATALQAGQDPPVLFPFAASRDRVLLFLQLAKTAGSTLAEILARNFSTDDVLGMAKTHLNTSVLGTWSNFEVERAYGRLRPKQIDRIRALWGPFRYGVHAAVPKPCAYVTLLRDPLERIISAYCDPRHPIRQLAALTELMGRKPNSELGLNNYMTRVLSGDPALDPIAPDATLGDCRLPTDEDFKCAAQNLDQCLVVGLAHRFDESLLVLGSDLGWSLSDLVYRRIDETPSRPLVGDVPTSIRDRLLEWNQLDAALVQRANAHLDGRIQRYLGDFQADLALFRKLNALFGEGASMDELLRIELEQRGRDLVRTPDHRRAHVLHDA